ncbi:hypothetical protein YC2023_043016 [Brassica napus]
MKNSYWVIKIGGDKQNLISTNFTFTLSLFYLIHPPILTDLSHHPRHLAPPTYRATAISPFDKGRKCVCLWEIIVAENLCIDHIRNEYK